jgi:outer membrane protein
MKRITGILIIVFAFISFVNGQKQWTLEECIKYALENNIQIKRQELQTKIAKNDYKQSEMQRLPDLNGNVSHNWNFGRNVDQFTNEIQTSNVMSDNFAIQSSVTLFSGFQIKNSIEQNKYLYEKSLKDLDKAKNDISLQIATIYLQILFNNEALEIAQSQLDVTKLQLEKTKRLYDVGNKPKGDYLQMQTQEASEKYNVITAKNNLAISYLTLKQILEMDTVSDFVIYRPDSINVTNVNILTSIDDTYDTALSNLPEIKSAELNLKSSEKGLDIARGEYYPKISLSASYFTGYSNARQKLISSSPGSQTIGYVNNDPSLPVLTDIMNIEMGTYPFFEQLKDNNSKAISFGLSIPIFNRFQTRKNVNNAKIRVLDSKYNVDQSKKTLFREIQTAHTEATAAFERFNASNEAVISNTESFKYIQQKYDVGMVSIVDYNIAKNDLIKAKSNFIQAKYEYVFKLKVLDFYKGLPIIL